MFVAALKSMQRDASIASAEFFVGRECEMNSFQRRQFRELKMHARKYSILSMFYCAVVVGSFVAATREPDRQGNL